jgi:hypothetical protein
MRLAGKLLMKQLTVMRTPITMAMAALFAATWPQGAPASTLQQLSLNDLIQKSTMIVRGTIQPGTTAAFRGPLIYTHYQLAVTTAYKGAAGAFIDVAVPGGALNGFQQPVAGAPMLTSGQDYVIFLWTSKSGLTQVIGLSQGLFTVTTTAQGQVIVSRGATTEPMLDSTGQIVTDTKIQMPLSVLANMIQAGLLGGAAQ